MKQEGWIILNAAIAMAAGIGFVLYSPLALAWYGILDSGGAAETYWYAVSFGRMFGAALFAWGMLLYALRGLELAEQTRRSLAFALLLSNLVALIASLTQQASVWGSITGWATCAIFLILLCGYGYFFFRTSA